MPRLALAILAVGLVVIAGGFTMGAPTAGERSGIHQAFAGYVRMPKSPVAKDNKIVSITVSTLDPRYAGARLFSKSAGPSEMLFHRSGPGWWVVAFGSSFGCDAAPKAVLADLKIGCAPPDGVAWINDCGPLVSAPRSIVITCADANYELARLTWHGWGGTAATAAGTARANTCTPNCAAGHFKSYPVSATADRLRTCGKAKYYARLTLVYAGARPAGVAKRDVHTLGC